MRSKALGFLWRFALVFALLITPWSGWKVTYGNAFRSLGNMIFQNDAGNRLLDFQAHQLTRGMASLDTNIVLGNRRMTKANGQLQVSMLGLDSRSIGWIPTALTIALILATPTPWRHRAWALLWGLILIHLYIMACVALYITNQSTTVHLLELPPFLKVLSDALEYTFVTQIGASFTVPVIIWILVTFSQKETEKWK